MMGREGQIEEMMKDIRTTGIAINGIDIAYGVYDKDDHFYRIAKALYYFGYRKQSEVVKEILQKMLNKMYKLTGCGVPYHVGKFINEIAAEYGVEVK